MTLQRLVLSTILSVATLTLVSIATAQTPSLALASVRVGFNPEGNSFEVTADSFLGGRIIAPDGTVFGDRSFPPDDVVSNLTETTLVNRFAGNWLYHPRWPSFADEYQFSVTGEQLIARVPVPEILSPPDGARLPPIFDIQHTGSGRTISGKTADGGGRFLSSSADGHVDESDRQLDSFPLFVTGWATNFNEVVLGPATTTSSNAREVVVSVVNRSFSTPRNWTIQVPEPASLSLIGLSLLSLAALRRRN